MFDTNGSNLTYKDSALRRFTCVELLRANKKSNVEGSWKTENNIHIINKFQ